LARLRQGIFSGQTKTYGKHTRGRKMGLTNSPAVTSCHRPNLPSHIALFLATLAPTTPTDTARCRNDMEKKKNDHEVSSLGANNWE
jgi:hypothetical protein